MAEHHLAASVTLPETPGLAPVVITGRVTVAVAFARSLELPPATSVLPPTRGGRRRGHRTPSPVLPWSPGRARSETLALPVPPLPTAAVGRGDRRLPPLFLARLHALAPLRGVHDRHGIVDRSRLLQLRRRRRSHRCRRRRRRGGALSVNALEYPIDLSDEAVVGAAVDRGYEARVEVSGRGEVDAAQQRGAVFARVVPVRRRRVLGTSAITASSRHVPAEQLQAQQQQR
uniref:DCL1 n=1 Tax=Arundo donax TaxID=35708 RepID=A0A0A9BLG7_ARUDO